MSQVRHVRRQPLRKKRDGTVTEVRLSLLGGGWRTRAEVAATVTKVTA
jgi:hypothetical protein